MQIQILGLLKPRTDARNMTLGYSRIALLPAAVVLDVTAMIRGMLFQKTLDAWVFELREGNPSCRESHHKVIAGFVDGHTCHSLLQIRLF